MSKQNDFYANYVEKLSEKILDLTNVHSESKIALLEAQTEVKMTNMNLELKQREIESLENEIERNRVNMGSLKLDLINLKSSEINLKNQLVLSDNTIDQNRNQLLNKGITNNLQLVATPESQSQDINSLDVKDSSKSQPNDIEKDSNMSDNDSYYERQARKKAVQKNSSFKPKDDLDSDDDEDVAKLQDDIVTSHKQSFVDMEAELANKVEEIEGLKKKIAELESSQKNKQEKVKSSTSLDPDLDKLKANIESLKENITQKDEAYEELEEEKKELEESKGNLEEDVKDYKKKLNKSKKENDELVKKCHSLTTEMVEWEKKMLITCMDFDELKGDKEILEREVRIIKSVSNLDLMDNNPNTDKSDISDTNFEELKNEVKELFDVEDVTKFKENLTRIVKKVINMRCKQQFGVENVSELCNSLEQSKK